MISLNFYFKNGKNKIYGYILSKWDLHTITVKLIKSVEKWIMLLIRYEIWIYSISTTQLDTIMWFDWCFRVFFSDAPITMPSTLFGLTPQKIICPHCEASISTKVTTQATTKTHLLALLMCILWVTKYVNNISYY